MKNKTNWKERIGYHVWMELILCGILALVLETVLEICDWRSISSFLVFFREKTWVFFYNSAIIFLTFLPVFFVTKKLFVYLLVSSIWLVIGITNGVMLGYRNTPFSAVDVTLLKSVLPIISNYLTVPQIVLIGILAVALVVFLVCLFLYSPRTEHKGSLLRRLICLTVIGTVFFGSTKYGMDHGLLEKRFSNIRLAYRDYGTAYCFVVTLFDNGIDRPVDYSLYKVENLMNRVEKKQKKLDQEEKKTPNVIFLQLESFFDVTRVEELEFSEDPIPFFRSMMQEYSSGLLSVPTYGAGTVNTEFEVITGMNKDYFGAGEYPFKSILQEKTSESICYVLKEDGYTAHAIHNNNATFYDRDYVYSNLGFDTFTTMEMMTVMERTQTGWVKDKILTKYIEQALDSTQGQDFIYTVSVQGHGEYPTKEISTNTIQVTGAESEEMNHQYSYYASQLKEMDDFLRELTQMLEERGEDTVLVVFGDHLPSLEIETEDLSEGTKIQTEYFIWNNLELKKEDKNIQAYQLYSRVLTQLGNHSGVMNRYHQVYQKETSYQDNLKLLQYDMLYGNNFAYGVRSPFESTDMRFGVQDIVIDSVSVAGDGKNLYFVGDGFTQYTDIYVNEKLRNTEFMGRVLIRWKNGTLDPGDEIYVVQRSKTNQRPVLWKSSVYVYQENGNLVLKDSE